MIVVVLVLAALDGAKRYVCTLLGHDEAYWVVRRCHRCGASFFKEEPRHAHL